MVGRSVVAASVAVVLSLNDNNFLIAGDGKDCC